MVPRRGFPAPTRVARAVLLGLLAAAGGTAGAQPAGLQVMSGGAVLSRTGTQLTVTTTNNAAGHSVLHWQSFSVPAGTTTRIEQPSVSSLSINRVVGETPSAILGTLSSNGRLALVNPAGIAVGPNAVVDTAGFTASTLRMTDAARPILRGEEAITLRRDTIQSARPANVVKALVSDEDAPLLSALKAKRRALAEEANVPAYVIFADRTLIEMAEKRPRTLDEMAGITGVGAKKLESFGAIFLAVVQGADSAGEDHLHPARMRLAGEDELHRTRLVAAQADDILHLLKNQLYRR